MSLPSLMTTALGGMRAQQSRMAATAQSIAAPPAPAPGAAARPDLTPAEASLESRLVDLKQSETAFRANAVVFETGADLWDMLMTTLDRE